MEFPLIPRLFLSWTGWPAEGAFPGRPAGPFFDALRAAWTADGLELQHVDWRSAEIQMAFQTGPDVSPEFFAGRVKGRLQHALRQAGTPIGFSRKTTVRALGDNVSDVVAGYLRKQTVRAALVDERYRATLRAAAFEDAAVDLAGRRRRRAGGTGSICIWWRRRRGVPDRPGGFSRQGLRRGFGVGAGDGLRAQGVRADAGPRARGGAGSAGADAAGAGGGAVAMPEPGGGVPVDERSGLCGDVFGVWAGNLEVLNSFTHAARAWGSPIDSRPPRVYPVGEEVRAAAG